MPNYQPRHSFNPNHPGDNNVQPLSNSTYHATEHIQGATDNTLAHSQPTQTPAANEVEEDMGTHPDKGDKAPFNHSRINFDPAHTCAACKVTCANNYALEKHAAKERHKAFLCTCTIKFVRLATLNRHIAAQAGPKHYCTYCDGNRGFAREDKLIDHFRASHKFGDNAIAQFRSQARAQPKANGRAASMAATPGSGLPVSTSTGLGAVPGGIAAQAGYSAGPAADPAGIFDGGLFDFPMFSAAEPQAHGAVDDYSWIGAPEDVVGLEISGLDFSGVEFADFDGDMDLSGMDGHL